MAKTLNSIRMDFQKTINQAEKLEQTAKCIKQIADQDLSSCMREVSSGWQGENARIFVGKGQRAVENLRSIESELKNTASTIRTLAQNTYNAEKNALEIAKQRKYK